MRGKKNEGKQEAENEMEPDKDDKREEDGDRQEKKQTGLSLCQTHYSPSHTHTHTRLLTRTTLTSHYLKEIFYSTLVSVSHRHICGGQLQLPMSCFPLLFILVDAAVM